MVWDLSRLPPTAMHSKWSKYVTWTHLPGILFPGASISSSLMRITPSSKSVSRLVTLSPPCLRVSFAQFVKVFFCTSTQSSPTEAPERSSLFAITGWNQQVRQEPWCNSGRVDYLYLCNQFAVDWLALTSVEAEPLNFLNFETVILQRFKKKFPSLLRTADNIGEDAHTPECISLHTVYMHVYTATSYWGEV